MDKGYADTVRLLLTVAPEVFANDIFAMKGGTAINLSGGLTDAMVECFVVYLAGHNRPLHEVLFGNDKDIAAEYDRAFVGMTDVPCSLDTLLAARAGLVFDAVPPRGRPAGSASGQRAGMISTGTASWPCHLPRMPLPLSDDDIFELEAFLMENRDMSEGMPEPARPGRQDLSIREPRSLHVEVPPTRKFHCSIRHPYGGITMLLDYEDYH
jgi:hypothetical protein